MKYQATIELKDDRICDGCPFERDVGGGFARTYCKYGEFEIAKERSENPNATGIYSWHTPRPRGCPLKPPQSTQYFRDYMQSLQANQRMMIPKDKPMYEVEK